MSILFLSRFEAKNILVQKFTNPDRFFFKYISKFDIQEVTVILVKSLTKYSKWALLFNSNKLFQNSQGERERKNSLFQFENYAFVKMKNSPCQYRRFETSNSAILFWRCVFCFWLVCCNNIRQKAFPPNYSRAKPSKKNGFTRKIHGKSKRTWTYYKKYVETSIKGEGEV